MESGHTFPELLHVTLCYEENKTKQLSPFEKATLESLLLRPKYKLKQHSQSHNQPLEGYCHKAEDDRLIRSNDNQVHTL